MTEMYERMYEEENQETVDYEKEYANYHLPIERIKYYFYDGELYTKTFPFIWAKTHINGTGPKHCNLCKTYGSWNGVFVGYCVWCAEMYNFDRGFGFEKGVQYGEYNTYTSNDNYCKSAANTYMKKVPLDDIGSIRMFDSAHKYKFYNTFLSLDEIVKQNTKKQMEKLESDLEQLFIIRTEINQIQKG